MLAQLQCLKKYEMGWRPLRPFHNPSPANAKGRENIFGLKMFCGAGTGSKWAKPLLRTNHYICTWLCIISHLISTKQFEQI